MLIDDIAAELNAKGITNDPNPEKIFTEMHGVAYGQGADDDTMDLFLVMDPDTTEAIDASELKSFLDKFGDAAMISDYFTDNQGQDVRTTESDINIDDDDDDLSPDEVEQEDIESVDGMDETENIGGEDDVYSLIGQKVDATIGDYTTAGEQVTVTREMIDSIGEYLGDEGIHEIRTSSVRTL